MDWPGRQRDLAGSDAGLDPPGHVDEGALPSGTLEGQTGALSREGEGLRQVSSIVRIPDRIVRILKVCAIICLVGFGCWFEIGGQDVCLCWQIPAR